MRQDIEVRVFERNWVVREVEYSPAVPATEIDPPESAELAYDSICLAGSDIGLEELLDYLVRDQIETAVLKTLEGN